MCKQRSVLLAVAVAAASGAAFAAEDVSMGEDVIAFYPMDDQAAGSDAHGQSIYNAVDASAFPGTVTASDTDNAFAKFDSDAPGTLIYIPGENNRIYYRNPGSIRAGSDAANGKGAMLSIASIGAEISKYHATGHTVEYFVKQDGTHSSGYSTSVQLTAGYKKVGGAANQPLRMYVPFGGGNSTSFVTSLNYYGDKVGDNPSRVDYTVPRAPGDGNWHHVALIARTDNKIDIYYDYVHMASLPTGGGSEVTGAAQTLEFFRNNMQGWVSCVRVTSRQLEVGEFLHATSRSEEWMDDFNLLAFIPCGGTAGSDVGSGCVTNVVAPSEFGGEVTLNGTAANPFARFAADQPGDTVYDGLRGKVLYRNPGSVAVGSDASDGKGAMLKFKGLGGQISQCHGSGYTLEYFIKLSGTRSTGYSATVAVYGGYANYIQGSGLALRMYTPLSPGASYAEAITCIDYCGDKPGDNVCRMDYKAQLHDDAWHHFAVVETNNEISVYFDYAYKGTFSPKGTSIVEGDVEFFRDNMQGSLSCVRVTRGVLEPKRFLRALDADSPWTDGGDAEGKMLAFYGFRDAAVGTDATQVRFMNAVDNMQYAGWAVLTTADSNPSAVFDGDAPGAAIYGGEEYPEKPFYCNPRSVAFTSETDGNSGRLYVGNELAQELVRCNTNEGYTVEFFFKMLDGNLSEWDPTLSINAGYGLGSLNVYLPYRKADKTYAFGFGSNPSDWKTVKMPDYLWDGKWHHIAVVETPVVDATAEPAVTNLEFRLWLDYRCAMPVLTHPVDRLGPSSQNALDICRNKLHAKYSCVKVTGRALTKKEFMRTKPRHRGTVIILR